MKIVILSIFIFLTTAEASATKMMCTQYYSLISIDGSAPTNKELAANEAWLKKVAFVLKHHKIRYIHDAKNDMCIDNAIIHDQSIKQYEQLAKNNEWLKSNGYTF